MRKVVISASSMPAGRNMSAQLDYITRVTTYGADMYHLDVVDGEFAPYKTIDYKYFDQLREKSNLLFDAHLMVANPEKVVDKYIKAGADMITVHYEAFQEEKDLINLLKKIKRKDKMVGLAIDFPTKIKFIDPFLPYLDLVLLLAVKAGKSGQEFNESVISKIKYVRSKDEKILISVDGGINPENAKKCVRAGADILCAGAYIYENETFEAIEKLKGKNG